MERGKKMINQKIEAATGVHGEGQGLWQAYNGRK